MKAMVPIAAALLASPAAAPAQQPIGRPGTVDHRAAGTGFPARIGAFRRANAILYDGDERNIGASYTMAGPAGLVQITVYVYPAPPVVLPPGAKETAETVRAAHCRREFEGTEAAILYQRPNATAVERGGAPAVAGAEPGLSHRSVYEVRAKDEAGGPGIRTEARLYCFVGGGWQVKYRITAPLGADSRAAVEAFIRAGPWPGRAPPPPLEETVALPAADAPAP